MTFTTFEKTAKLNELGADYMAKCEAWLKENEAEFLGVMGEKAVTSAAFQGVGNTVVVRNEPGEGGSVLANSYAHGVALLLAQQPDPGAAMGSFIDLVEAKFLEIAMTSGPPPIIKAANAQ